ncbi:50S ribosomal protein L19e [Candidatus Woesearchaeota archaeon]|nr:50S ribosomal protein L19e [Candidatus Woesearchaeota archaeon]
MNLTVQKRLAAQLLNCGENRVTFTQDHLPEIKEAITKADLRGLIAQGIVSRTPTQNTSRGRARAAATQKGKGRRSGHGSRKGLASARTDHKRDWINRIRLQRELLQNLKTAGKLSPKGFRSVSQKAKGGYFRSRRHVKLYLEENRLLT